MMIYIKTWLKGAIIRSKATWYEKGERSKKSSIGKIFNEEGVLIKDPKKVQREIERFYSDLGKSNTLSPSENMLNSFFEKS